MSTLRERFGRPLRLAVIGGGPGAWIGTMHRGAAEMDGHWKVVAGVFSSDAQRSRDAGATLGMDPARAYGDVAGLQRQIAEERVRALSAFKADVESGGFPGEREVSRIPADELAAFQASLVTD